MRKKLVAGNWKSNGSFASISVLAEALAFGTEGVEMAVFPPFVYLPIVKQLLSGSSVRLGAQNLSQSGPGAYTGEINAAMLCDVGCEYVLIGHSERRSLFGEDDGVVAQKLNNAIAGGLKPILCIGESLDQRLNGMARQIVLGQLQNAVAGMVEQGLEKLTLAYEPVWAIGTGRSAAPAEVQEVHGWIREWLNALNVQGADCIRLLYGGSVTPINAEALFLCPDVDGALVGGASLNSVDFLSICRSAANIARAIK